MALERSRRAREKAERENRRKLEKAAAEVRVALPRSTTRFFIQT